MFPTRCSFRGRSYRPLIEGLEARNLPSFLPAVNYPVGALPVDVAVADFDNDNIPDLAVTNRDSGMVSILLGNGDGTFRNGGNIPAGDSPFGVTVGDFNGDGKLDLAVTNQFGNVGVSVLLGNGDGTFQPRVFYPLFGVRRPEPIATADLNNDGNLDLVTANLDGAPLSVLLGNGDGTFQNAVNYGSVSFAHFMAVADLTGNGDLDIVVSNISNILTVFYGDGTGAFPTSRSFSVSTALGVAIGDVNGDGIPDLVAASYPNNQVAVLLGNGDGTFQNPMYYSVGSGQAPWSIVLADFDGDGNLDAATSNNSGDVSVLLGNGDGSFQRGQTYSAGGGAAGGFSFGDFNGDGFPDLVTANFQFNNISVLINAADWGGGFPVPRQDPRPAGRDQTNAGLVPLSVGSLDQDDQGLPQSLWTIAGRAQQSMQPGPMAAVSDGPRQPESPSMPTSAAILRDPPDAVLEVWVDPVVQVLELNLLR
jgi:hypothetical protein